MATKFLLIEVADRDIAQPKLHDTMAAAQEEMLLHACSAVGISDEDAANMTYDEKVKTIESYEGAVLTTMTYCEHHHIKFDWAIFEIEV